MTTNKLTVITINKNNAEGLKRTMNSVLSQSFTDFEYIIVDGASTDRSCQVITEMLCDKSLVINDVEKNVFHAGHLHETKLNGINCKLIIEKDTGVYNAMNKGIKMAIGEYLLFLNSGDFLVNGTVLEKVFSKENVADILCARCNVSESGKVIWTSNPPENITFGTLYNVGLAHQSTFIRSSLFKACGLYREDYKYNSDIDFWYKSIILNAAITEKIDVIVSDYNLDGISSKEHETEQYKKEINEILSQANFNKFSPDYEAWKAERKEMEVMYWIKSKKQLYNLIEKLYEFANWVVSKRKSKMKNSN